MQSSSATASELVSTARSSCCFKCKCRKAAMGKQQWNSSPLHDCERVISLLHQSQSASYAILTSYTAFCMIPVIVTRNRILLIQIISRSDRRCDSMSQDSMPTEGADLACNDTCAGICYIICAGSSYTMRASICYTCCVRRASQQLHQSHRDR